MGKQKRTREDRFPYIPIALVDEINLVEQKTSDLAQALRCTYVAILSEPEDEGAYIEGTLSVLLESACRVHEHAESSACMASQFALEARE